MLTIFHGSEPVTVEVSSDGSVELSGGGCTIRFDHKCTDELFEYLGYPNLDNELEEAEQEISDLEAKITSLREEMDDMKDEKDDEIESLETTAKELTTKIEGLEEMVEKLEGLLAELNSKD